MSSYPTITVEYREQRPYAGLTGSVTMSDFAPVVDRIPEIFHRLGALGVAPAGVPFLRYRVIDMERELIVQAGVPLARPISATDDLEVGVLPAGRYVTTTYTGAPENLVEVTGVLLDWAADQGLVFDQYPSDAGDVWGCRLEFLDIGPVEVPDPAYWQTTLAFRLAE